MRIYLTSDIHLERLDNISRLIKKYQTKLSNHPSDQEKYLICAGNICSANHRNFKVYFSEVSPLFDLVFFVPGNLEYHNSTLDQALDIMINDVPINVITLHKSFFDIPRTNVRIVGTTLWSDLMFPETEPNDMRLHHCRHQSTDFTEVLDLTPRRYYQLYIEQRQFLENTINKSVKDLIIITHHIPAYELIDPIYKDIGINHCVGSNLTHLFSSKVKLWCYGHSHKSTDVIMNGTRLICNPVGYKSENKNPELLKSIDF